MNDQPEKIIELKRPVACRETVGTCRIDDGELNVRLTLEADAIGTVPDVLNVEAWLRAYLKTPTTVEEVAIAAADHWKMKATAEGESRTHGTITATCGG